MVFYIWSSGMVGTMLQLEVFIKFFLRQFFFNNFFYSKFFLCFFLRSSFFYEHTGNE
eukprot:UN03437